MNVKLQSVASQFSNQGKFLRAEPYGQGHINDTYAVYFLTKGDCTYRVILQRINHAVFNNPQGLMNNIYCVTQHIKQKVKMMGGDEYRETLTVIPTVNGGLFYRNGDGNFWRMYVFIENAVSYQSIRNEQDFFNCGITFGNFQRMLADFPTDKLTETIAAFHNTVKRYQDFKSAVKNDKAGRVKGVGREIEFAMKREKDAALIVDMLDKKEIPYRVTHNDTKLNNIMIDSQTGKGICVIDLDTVMPGAACYDFGDSIRFGASTAAEDETDLSKVEMSMRLFEAFSSGYLSVAKEFLTQEEKDNLVIGAKLMTLECGVRFLTDYLNGDIYYKVSRPEHNLDRMRTQRKLIESMDNQWDVLEAAIR